MTVAQAYEAECTNGNRHIPWIAIIDKDGSGRAEFNYANEYLETHGYQEVKQAFFIEKRNCVYIELTD